MNQRWTPVQQLHRLAEFSPRDDDWATEWLGDLLRDPRARDWGEAELQLLVRLLLTHQLYELLDNQVVLALATHYPETVWSEGLKHAHALDDLISLHTLAKLPDDVVTRLAAAATNPAARGAAAAYLAWRNQPPSPPPTPPPPPPSQSTLADLVDADDLPRLFRREPDPAELAQLDPDRRARLATRLTAALDEWVTLLPDPWPPKLAAALTEACWATGADEPTRRRCASQLARSGLRDVAERLRTAAGDPLLDEALVLLGDCTAEARLLDRLLASPTWPITTPASTCATTGWPACTVPTQAANWCRRCAHCCSPAPTRPNSRRYSALCSPSPDPTRSSWSTGSRSTRPSPKGRFCGTGGKNSSMSCLSSEPAPPALAASRGSPPSC